ncbi:MAG: metallo-mystery pair system four-Cys motif protein [Deltaproteobacteria bacterium]|nr:metallo-mystery pair system four-Cys motif protein [Deltaproteobacteria bacterium]
MKMRKGRNRDLRHNRMGILGSPLLLSVCVGVGVGVGACGDGKSEDTQREVQGTLRFSAVVGDALASCTTSYAGLGTTSSEAKLGDARFFVSQIALKDGAGAWVQPTLTAANGWQSSGVALLDFEDKSQACSDTGTVDVNEKVEFSVPVNASVAQQSKGLRFSVGVPFELNHNDSATQPSPFNVPGMFWSWQGGYKFLKVDWLVDTTSTSTASATTRWNIHIGSTACSAPAATSPPTAPCGRPNLATIELADFDWRTDEIVVDFGALVENADLSLDHGQAPGCMSSPAEPDDCTGVFSALGLGFESGACIDACEGQSVFRVQTAP